MCHVGTLLYYIFFCKDKTLDNASQTILTALQHI